MQKILSSNNLIVLAAHTAIRDEEFYVVTTALRCLAAATKIESLWTDVTIAHKNLYMQLITILKYSPEGIVRKEAANVLTEVYTNQKVTKHFMTNIYRVMSSAALEDLHWEVQIAALNFWKQAILRQLSNRGMIDGKFPTVTFSKEKRKIITLDDAEIVKQLTSIMKELSTIGCIHVLHKCLRDDNIDVMEHAYNITKELVNILDRYRFSTIPEDVIELNDSIDVDQETCQHVPMDLSCAPNKQLNEIQDRVIDEILNTTQADLISQLHEKYVKVKSEAMGDEEIVTCTNKNIMNPNEFLKLFKETDYLSILEDKKNWCAGPSDLDTILDEILLVGENRPYEEDR